MPSLVMGRLLIFVSGKMFGKTGRTARGRRIIAG